MSEITIICDNGGGITLQIIEGEYRFQHTYSDAKHVATDIKEASNNYPNLPLQDWESNEAGNGWIEPTGEEVRNGGYKVLSPEDFEGHNIDQHCGWLNVVELSDALGN